MTNEELLREAARLFEWLQGGQANELRTSHREVRAWLSAYASRAAQQPDGAAATATQVVADWNAELAAEAERRGAEMERAACEKIARDRATDESRIMAGERRAEAEVIADAIAARGGRP